MTTTSIDTKARFNDDGNPVQAPEMQAGGTEQGTGAGKPESELRAAARRHGLTLKELAARMGVSYGYLSSVSAGRRPWSPMLRERAMAVLGEVPGQGVVYRQGGLVKGESSFIRERAREIGMSMGELAEQVGVSAGFMSDVSRGRRNMAPRVQARVEAVLAAPARVEAAQPACVDQRALWDRMNAHGLSQNEVARLAGISSGHLSQIMNGQRTPSADVLEKLHGVLFRPSAAELVVPAELPPSTRCRTCPAWDLSSSGPKKRLSGRMRLNGKPSWQIVCRAVGGDPTDQSQDILCRLGPLPGGRPTAGQVGAEKGTGAGGLDQPPPRREGQLLFGGVPGDRRGGVDGTGGNGNTGTSGAFLNQLRERHFGLLKVI